MTDVNKDLPCGSCGGLGWIRPGEQPCPTCTPRLGANQCEHGSLARSCNVCELTAERDALRARVAELEGALRSANLMAYGGELVSFDPMKPIAAPPAKPSALDEALAAWRALSGNERATIVDKYHLRTGSPQANVVFNLLRAAAVKS